MQTNRTRITDNLVNTTPCTITSTHGNGTSLGTSTIGSLRQVGVYESISDVVFPNFNERLKAGEILMGDLARRKFNTETSNDVLYLGPYPNWNQGGRQVIEGNFTQFVESAMSLTLDYEPDVSRAEAISLVKCYDKMNSPPIMGGELLGTLGKTFQMLKKPFNGTIQMLKEAKKVTRITNVARKRKYDVERDPFKVFTLAAEAVASGRLETRYGWTPMLLDYDTALREGIRFVEKDYQKRYVARASERVGQKVSKYFDVPYSGSSALRVKGNARRQFDARVSSGLIYEYVSHAPSDVFMRTLGLNGRDLLPTLWELVPLSFVVDWFTNVGRWINAVTPNPDVRILGLWTTSVVHETLDWDPGTWTCTQLGTTNGGTYGGASQQRVLINRWTNPALPLHPSLLWKAPSVSQTMDGIALSCKTVVELLKDLRR